MSDPLFVPHITLDGIVTLLSIGAGVAVYLVKEMRRRDRTEIKIDALTNKVEEHGNKIDKLTTVVEVQARHDERIMGLERWRNLSDQRWEDMRHGKGMVVEEP